MIFGLPIWAWILFSFVYAAVIVLWSVVVVDVFKRPDMSGGAKFLWIIGVFTFPFLGSLVYLLSRPSAIEKEMKQTKIAA